MFFSKFREQRAEELDKGIKEIDEDVEKFILKDNNLLAIKGTSEYASSIRKDSPTNRIVTSLYSRDRLRFILQYGLCYKETVDKNGIKHIEKHIMRYPQIFATLAIRVRLSEGVKKGVIWHTQGSGKTALAFSNVHFLRDYYQNQGKIAKFYFIVDRLDLATQAKAEFEARGLKVNMISSKEDFKTNIAAVGETDNTGKTSITVVNIQKFSDESVTKQSDYNVSVQRVYFLDEAHRSYNPKGSFLANLMASDRDAVMIALTGTPLIGDGYNTKDVFGNYIHKYYYNQSIADGYTLKLIREEIETKYKTELASTLEMLEVQHGSIEKKELYAHPKFVSAMVDYIVHDFEKGRTTLDDSIGAMIVCDSAPQARAVSEQLSRIAKYSHALVLHDEGTKQDRKDIQEDFKKGKIDILVVYNMLLTGFDAPRLKKQYLARMIKAHNLLQTLTRVNRPYKDYHYGYVVDFANIKEEFDKTNKAYFEELQSELGDEVANYSEIFKSREEIEQDLNTIKNQLFLYDTENMVEFINQINEIDDKKTLLDLKNALTNYKALHNLIRLFGYDDLYIHFDVDKAIQMLNEVTARDLNSILLQESIGKVCLIGMSMGGYPSQMFAYLYPEKVQCFVGIDTTPFRTEYYSKSDLWWLSKVKTMAEWFTDKTLRKSMAKSVAVTDYSYNKMIEMLKPMSKEQIIEQMDIAYGKLASEIRDIDLNCPVLILLGDKDKTGKVKQYCTEWARKTGYPLHIIKNAAHFSNGDNAEQVNAEIEKFISSMSILTNR